MRIDNVADLIAETLVQAGVKRVFGVVGDSLNGLTDALRKRKTIDWIHVRHEEVAAFAAAGEAQITGRACGLCGIVRSGQPPPHQRTVRRPPQPHAGAGDRRPDPVRRNRRRLFPGDPSAGFVSGMQSLLRTGFRYGAAALRSGKRHPRRCGATWRGRARHPRRRRAAVGAQAWHLAECRTAAGRAHRSARRTRTDGVGRTPEQRQTRHAVLRPRLRRRP